MKVFRVPSLILAGVLQVLPIARVIAVYEQPVAPLWAIIMRWAGAAAAALGSVEAVSGASTVITNPLTAQGTNGVAFKQFRLTTAPDQAHYWTATGLPPGLKLNGTSGATLWYINGTPTAAGSFNVRLTAKDQINSGFDRTVSATLVINILGTGTAPTITGPPTSQTVPQGATVTFTVTATGTAPLGYQWQKDNQNISGANTASLVLQNVTSSDAGSYTVQVSNSIGSTTSAAATLTVTVPITPPSLLVQPTSQTVTAGAAVTLSVFAGGSAPLSYQWSKNDQNIPGATNPSLTFSSASVDDSGTYRVLVSNAGGSAVSDPATLTVNPPITAPAITTQPQSQTVNSGAAVTLSVVATGTAPLSYQWRKNDLEIAGATSSTLTFGSASTTDSGEYRVLVTNPGGSALSDPATLTVASPATGPTITSAPASLSVHSGQNASFSVAATGTEPLSYKWFLGSAEIPGATGPSLNLTAVDTTAAGDYSVEVSNPAGKTQSGPAKLTVSVLQILSAVENGDATTITWDGITGETYGLQAKTDLGGTWQPLSLPTPTVTNGLMTATLPNSAGKFFRLSVAP